MPVSLDELFAADAAESIARRRDNTQLALARQSDGAAQDMRVVGGLIAAELLAANDPMTMAGLNAGVRTPTTLDHPGNPSSA
jgi:hypothetical protein